MLVYRNEKEGIAPTLYRSTTEIRRDISKINARIKEADEMLSIRNILTEMIDQFAVTSPEEWIPELEQTLAEAREAMEKLQRLRDALTELSVELEEAKWVKRNL